MKKTKLHRVPRLGRFMSVENMTSSLGNTIANQFLIRFQEGQVFQSYNSIIVVRYRHNIYIGKNRAYSTTTGKYRNQFLGETKRETQAKINSGEYLLLNE